MPVETIITCDICGAPARQHHAPFWIRDANEHEYRGVGHGMAEKVPYAPALETAHTVSKSNWIGPNPYTVYLCKAHHASLIGACEAWLSAAVDTAVES